MTAEVDGLIERLDVVRRNRERVVSVGELETLCKEARTALSRLQRERDEYKIWWERDSTSLGKMIADRNAQRVYAQDFRALAATRLDELQEQQRVVEGLRPLRDDIQWLLDNYESRGFLTDAALRKHLASLDAAIKEKQE